MPCFKDADEVYATLGKLFQDLAVVAFLGGVSAVGAIVAVLAVWVELGLISAGEARLANAAPLATMLEIVTATLPLLIRRCVYTTEPPGAMISQNML